MWREAALLAVGCVLFINMGLSEAVQETLRFHSRILSCPKCCTFWATIIFLLFSGCRITTAVGASFLFSYLALWADLGLSALNKIYNDCYKQISASKAAKTRSGKSKKGGAGVPEMRRES